MIISYKLWQWLQNNTAGNQITVTNFLSKKGYFEVFTWLRTDLHMASTQPAIKNTWNFQTVCPKNIGLGKLCSTVSNFLPNFFPNKNGLNVTYLLKVISIWWIVIVLDCHGVIIVNFGYISHLFVVFPLLTLNR